MTTTTDTVRVLVADDDFDMRLLLRATLGGDQRVEVVAEVEDGPNAVEAFRTSEPDVCILDYRMPGLTGLEAAAQILARRPDAKILLFSAYLTPEIVEAADALGIGCLRKDRFMDLPATVIEIVESA